MADQPDICIIPDCYDDVKYKHLEVCGACYSSLARWRGRSVAHKRSHFERCERLVSRMDFMIENPRHHPQKQGS